MEQDTEIIVVGAGASGVAAASCLHQYGRDVLVLEARERMGGRIFTERGTRGAALEMGAERVHGYPPVIDRILQKFELLALPAARTTFCFETDQFTKTSDFWGRLESSLDPIKKRFAPAQPVSEYLDTVRPEDRELAREFIEGYEAADVDLMGQEELALATMSSSESARESRSLPNGYLQILDALVSEAPGVNRKFKFQRNITGIHWKKGDCTLIADVAGHEEVHRCKKVIVTIPIGVLKAKSVRFPPLSSILTVT